MLIACAQCAERPGVTFSSRPFRPQRSLIPTLCESMMEHQYRLDFAGIYDHTFMLHFPLHPFQPLVILKPAEITHYKSVRKYKGIFLQRGAISV